MHGAVEPHSDRLSDTQLEAFDREYVSESRWEPIKACIDRDFPDGHFSFLDLGGGNGLFADKVLRCYPKCTGTVLDASQMLIARNKPNARKVVLVGDALNPVGVGKFDIVFCNWLLHHLVRTGDYAASRKNIESALRGAKDLLTPNGKLSIYENEYNGYIDVFPSRAIFAVTSSKTLSSIARRLGANTAGVGVCFLSFNEWKKTLHACGLTLLSHSAMPFNATSRLKRTLLLVRSLNVAHYWATPSSL